MKLITVEKVIGVIGVIGIIYAFSVNVNLGDQTGRDNVDRSNAYAPQTAQDSPGALQVQGDLNVDTDRELDAKAISDLGQLLQPYEGKKIQMMRAAGDGESLKYANKIRDHLIRDGWGVCPGVIDFQGSVPESKFGVHIVSGLDDDYFKSLCPNGIFLLAGHKS